MSANTAGWGGEALGEGEIFGEIFQKASTWGISEEASRQLQGCVGLQPSLGSAEPRTWEKGS